MQDSEIKVENEEGQNPRLRKVNIPKQDFKTNKAAVRPLLDNEIAEQLKEVFELFSSTDRVNPYDIKNGLRSVNFHKENPKIYKLIEELCLQYDMDETPITFEEFLDFLNEKLGDNASRIGINNVFLKLMDPEVNEITAEALHKVIEELGDELSLDDIKYILEKVSEPSTDINITSDEFYYIMTKKPADVDLITPVTKSTK